MKVKPFAGFVPFPEEVALLASRQFFGVALRLGELAQPTS